MGKRRTLRTNFSNNPERWETVIACGGKTEYVTKKAAMGAASLARKESRDLNIDWFKCNFGNHFHIGHDKYRQKNGERITA